MGYTVNVRFLVIRISNISRVTEGFYESVVGESGPKIGQEFTSPNHVDVSPSRAQPQI